MIIEKQQFANGTVIKDSVAQLLKSDMLNQENLGSKVDYEEIDKLVDDVSSISEDDIVGSYHAHRSKRNLYSLIEKLIKAIKILQKVDKASSKRIGKNPEINTVSQFHTCSVH